MKIRLILYGINRLRERQIYDFDDVVSISIDRILHKKEARLVIEFDEYKLKKALST